MTKETKIGLLVGLAFIVLFAIILSEKGAGPRQIHAPQFTQADNIANPANKADRPLANDGRFPIESILPEPVKSTPKTTKVAKTDKPKDAPTPALADATPKPGKHDTLTVPGVAPSTGGSLIDKVDGSMKDLVARSPTEADGTAPGGMSSTPIIPAPTTPARDTIASGSGSRTIEDAVQHAVRDALDSNRRGSGIDDMTRTDSDLGATKVADGRKPSTDDAPKGPSRTYVVAAGDTIYGIAKKMYGTSSRSAIDTIYRANNKSLKSVNSLKLGQKLIIPDVAGLALAHNSLPQDGPADPVIPTPIDSADKTAAQPERTAIPTTSDRTASATTPGKGDAASRSDARADRPKAAARTYEVRPRDTLIRIAREQLGDARRHVEIQKLNRDVIGKRNVLKPGMKLRLPAKDDSSSSRSDDTTPSGSARVTAPGLEVASRD